MFIFLSTENHLFNVRFDDNKKKPTKYLTKFIKKWDFSKVNNIQK